MKPNILIVDDKGHIRQIIKKILVNNGYNTLEAEDSKGALQSFETNNIDLVLMDLVLPDVDGLTTAKMMMTAKPQIPLILITGEGSTAIAVEAVKSGIYDYLEKPLDRERLLITIRNALSWGYTRQELDRYKNDSLSHYQMVGQSESMKRVFAIIEKIATTDTPVLILGKNGVGKELVARAIHNGSARANRKMININCGAIPDNLIESELFGHVKGAFTGAILAKTGRIQMADKSTLFLDEVGDLTPSAQAKLLRFLENGEIQKVGSTETHFVDTRIITGTNKNLIKMVEKKEFREDLYYRLEVITICIPPLKERKTDIPLLLDHFMEITAQTYGIIKPHLTPASVKYLTHYDWPGNVRQLKHFIERLLIMTNCDVLDIQHIKSYLNEVKKSTAETDIQSFKEAKRAFERDYLTQTLSQTHGNLSKAANILKMDRGNLSRKMKQLGLQH